MVLLRSRVQANHEPVSDEHSDEELVLMSLSDPAQFAPLYRRYAASVYRYCDRCLGNREDAEEATQTVFMRALASLGTCRNPAAFRPWLFAIAHNVIINDRKARRPVESLDNEMAATDRAASPEDQAMAAIQHREITLLLSQLPADQREAVELRMQGLSDKEIAAVLGRSPGSIRTAQYRAVLKLRKLAGVPSGEGRDEDH